MKILIIITTIALLVNSCHCIRNLFLPRTGEINTNPGIVAENLSNVTNFQSLLGAGRSLAYPFAAGVLLSIATLANENNWKVSDVGFSQILGVPREEILDSYGALLDMLETDDNVTLSNILFSLRPNYSPSEELTETLMTEVREVTWTRDTWLDTYNLMVEHLSNVTNEKIDNRLIPSVTKIGTPFRKSTQAIALSSFHYINGWQLPWTDAEVGKFGDNEGIPYLKVEGTFLVAEEEEFTAVSVPLEGGMKNMVFVLPHVNISAKYFRTSPEENEDLNSNDVVPFPRNWKPKKLRFKVPAFNTTDVDQYGQELEQIGMNETFCTILRDFFGRYPYYMRPMVQVNFLDFNEDYLELASATGVAVERFQSLLSLLQEINSRPENAEDDDEYRRKHSSRPSPLVDGKGAAEVNDPSSSRNASIVTSASETGYISLEDGNSTDDYETLALDRSFLWYLNDSEVGPMFFGTVEVLINLALAENSTEPGGEDDGNMAMTTTMNPSIVDGGEEGITAEVTTTEPTSTTPRGPSEEEINAYLAEIEKFYLWSCRSFAPTSGGPNNNISNIIDGGLGGKRRIPNYFAVSFDEDDLLQQQNSNNSSSSSSSSSPSSPSP